MASTMTYFRVALSTLVRPIGKDGEEEALSFRKRDKNDAAIGNRRCVIDRRGGECREFSDRRERAIALNTPTCAELVGILSLLSLLSSRRYFDRKKESRALNAPVLLGHRGFHNQTIVSYHSHLSLSPLREIAGSLNIFASTQSRSD